MPLSSLQRGEEGGTQKKKSGQSEMRGVRESEVATGDECRDIKEAPGRP